MRQGDYSMYSDVYAFGVLLWEIWHSNSRPFDTLPEVAIINLVQTGKRPQISNDCPAEMKTLIERCWHDNPKQRPNALQIVQTLQQTKPQISTSSYNSNSGQYFQYGHIYHSNSSNNSAYPNLQTDPYRSNTSNKKY